jgi:chromosome partitioning protein
MFVIALYNLKGGVGKTAACVNLAHLAAQDGYNTLLWDLDPQAASSFYYEVDKAAQAAVRKWLEKSLTLDELVHQTTYDSLDIIPADKSSRKLDILLDGKQNKKQIKQLLKSAKHTYDFVFIDCPPAFSNLADNIFEAADAVILPTIPTTLSLRTFQIVKDYFQQKGLSIDKLMCFFSMVDSRKNLHQQLLEHEDSSVRFFESVIPNLADIEKMGIMRAPVTAFAPQSRAAQAYIALWTEIKEGVL